MSLKKEEATARTQKARKEQFYHEPHFRLVRRWEKAGEDSDGLRCIVAASQHSAKGCMLLHRGIFKHLKPRLMTSKRLI